MSGESDVMIGQLSITYDRYKFLDYLTPLYARDMRFIHTWPKTVEDFGTILYPFQLYAWVATIASSLFIGISLFLIDKVELGLFQMKDRDISFKGVNNIINNILQVSRELLCLILAFTIGFTALINEPVPLNWLISHSKSRQIIFWIWLPTGIILSFAYKSNLLAHLIAFTYQPPIETAQDVLDSGLPLFIEQRSWHEYFFRLNSQPIMRQVSIT